MQSDSHPGPPGWRIVHTLRGQHLARVKVSRTCSPGLLCCLAFGLLFPALPIPATLVVQVGKNFTGSTYGVDSSARPADGNGAVGPSHFVEFINGRFAVFDKASGNRVQTKTDRAFWTSAGVSLSANLSVTDPRIVFDLPSQRWFASQVDFNSNNQANRFLLAVSASADPTGPWSGFAFLADPVNGSFADFPTLGLDADGVYLSGDMFDGAGNSLGPSLVAIPKSGLLSTPPSVAGRKSFGILNYSTRGYILQPSVSVGGASSDEVVLAVGDLGFDYQAHSTLVSFHVQNAANAGNATLSDPAILSVPPYSVPINPPQPDGSGNLDNGDTRFSATVCRIGDVLYAVHSTEMNGRAAVQWFIINATNQTVMQNGTITDTNLDLFFPSIAANSTGTVVIGCNGSSSNTFVSSYAVVGEPVNGTLTFGGLMQLKAGTVSYQDTDASGNSRWGDYSATSLDPSDPNRFWTIQMFPSGPAAWSTQITELITRQLVLTITSANTNILLSWPSAATGFQLQFPAVPSSASAWTPVTQSPTTTNDLFTVLLPASGSQGFFRLAKP